MAYGHHYPVILGQNFEVIDIQQRQVLRGCAFEKSYIGKLHLVRTIKQKHSYDHYSEED